MDQLLTVHQVADLLQIHHNTVRDLIKADKLAGIKVGKSWRIDLADLEKYIKKRKTKTLGYYRE